MEQYYTGAIIDKRDIRDYLYRDIAGAFPSFDWSAEFNVEDKIGKIKVKNQYQSSSCGGQAWGYYSYALDQTDREEKSAKFIYAQTHVQGGGSAGRENSELCRSKGVSSEQLCKSYMESGLTSEEFMINVGDITPEAYKNALTNREKSYLAVNTDIDSVAQAIRDNNGVVLGVTGQNNGTWTSAFPKPPTSWTNSWNHWLYAGKVKMIDGKKYIGVLNSWGENVGEKGWQWLGEEYFNGTWIWSCWTMIYNADTPYVFSKTLRYGSRGFDVVMLQTKLGIPADGKFGNQTKSAVIKFQISHGLVGDGIVGKLTNAELNKL